MEMSIWKKIKYTLALVASIGCVVLLSFASYLQIHDHIYKGLFWNGLLIIFLLFSSSIYLKKLIKGSDNNQTETINPEILSIEQNAKIKTMTIIESITFWCAWFWWLMLRGNKKKIHNFHTFCLQLPEH